MLTDSGVAPLSVIRRAVSDVLDGALVPMHYAELTELALGAAQAPLEAVDVKRQKEDVREKVLLAGQNGMFYSGSPLCMGAKARWFKLAQRQFLFSADESVWIPADNFVALAASVEAQLRAPTMVAKRDWTRAACHLFATDPRAALRDRSVVGCLSARFTAQVGGLMTEALVSSWFQSQWPQLWVEKSNAGDYARPCSDDFRLSFGDELRAVDVMSRNKHGEYANPGGGKSPAYYHVLCRLDRHGVTWERVVRGADFAESDGAIPEIVGLTAVQMTVYLNCVASGIDYVALRRSAPAA